MECPSYDRTSTQTLASNAEWIHENSAQIAIKLFHGHTAAIKTCQLIETKNWLLTGSDDNTARLWDFNSGKEIHKYQLRHDMAAISAVRTNQDATRFYSASWDKTVRCFDLETGQEIWKGVHKDLITSCQISHDGFDLCSGSDSNSLITIWDTKSGLIKSSLGNLHESTITSCQYNLADSRLISTSFDKTTKVFDLISHRITMTLRDHQSVVSNCSFNQQERLYATCSWDKMILLYDISTGRFRDEGPLMLPKLHEGSIAACHMSNDGKLLVSGGYDSRVILWDINNLACTLVLRGHHGWVNDVCLTRDNKWIVSVSHDCDIRLWHIEHCDEIKQVIEQNKRLQNVKIANCSHCGKTFAIHKLKRDHLSATFLCVFCHHEQSSRSQQI